MNKASSVFLIVSILLSSANVFASDAEGEFQKLQFAQQESQLKQSVLSGIESNLKKKVILLGEIEYKTPLEGYNEDPSSFGYGNYFQEQKSYAKVKAEDGTVYVCDVKLSYDNYELYNSDVTCLEQ